MKPRLALTMGDINGIGPEILVKALARPQVWDVCRPVVIGGARVFETARASVPLCPPCRVIQTLAEVDWAGAPVPLLEAGQEIPEQQWGVLDAAAGRCAVEWVKRAVQEIQAGTVNGVVTCPLNKEGIHRAGYTYAGHTELIAEMTGSPEYRMCLFAGAMRIVHITSHLSLREALAAVQKERIAASIRVGHEALTRLSLSRRRIAVAGVNPHAGEAGAFGTEEQEEIIPAIQRCQQEGIDCDGPYPADTVFRRLCAGEFDLVVSMYHDQGHIPAKLIAMDEGVNVTLGIPIVRTSVDHGTAYDIAGQGVAREDSLCAAVELAAQLAG